MLTSVIEFALGGLERAEGRAQPLFREGTALPQHLDLSGSARLGIEGAGVLGGGVSVLQLTAAAPFHSRTDAGSAELSLGQSAGPWLSV